MTPEGRNARTAVLGFALVVAMAGLSFAAVPFYRWFCAVTGFGGETAIAEAAPGAVADAWVTVRFVAVTDPALPWDFRPEQTSMRVRVGEEALAFYTATSRADRPTGGRAVFNVTPDAAGGYLAKIACFCFDEQVLAPRETARMPVSFFVDPAMLGDPDARGLREITLGYVFYPAELPEPGTQAALAPAPSPLTAAPAASID